MTTPNSGQISLGDLKSELSLVGGPSANISLAEAAGYNMANGFWDTYAFLYPTNYSSAPVNLSYFYNLQVEASYVFEIDISCVNYDLFFSFLTNQSQAGGGNGPNVQPANYNNPASGTLSPNTTSGIDIVHMADLDVTVGCVNNSPRPPFADIYIEFNDTQGGGYVGFPGSPFNGPVVNVNSGAQINAPNSVGTPTVYTRCYQ